MHALQCGVESLTSVLKNFETRRNAHTLLSLLVLSRIISAASLRAGTSFGLFRFCFVCVFGCEVSCAKCSLAYGFFLIFRSYLLFHFRTSHTEQKCGVYFKALIQGQVWSVFPPKAMPVCAIAYEK